MTGQITSHNNIGWSKAHTDAYNAYIKASDNYAKEAADVDRVKTKAANCEATYNFNNNLASKTSLDLSSKNTSITSLQGEITNLENQKNSTSNSSMQSAIQSTITQKNNEIAKLREQAAQLKRDLNKYQSQAKTNLDEAQRLRREDQVKEQNEANQAKTAMNNAKKALQAEEQKDVQTRSSNGVSGEIAANKDNRNFYEQRAAAAKNEITSYGTEISRYQTSIKDLQTSIVEYKAEQQKNGYPVDAAVVNLMLATIQEAEQKITEIENNIKKCEVLIKDSETSITNIDASINEVRAINGLRDSSNFSAIEDLTDASAAFKQYEKAKKNDTEINTNLTKALNIKTSCAQTFGTERASLKGQLKELSDLQGKVPDSDKIAVGKKMLEINNKIAEMDNAEKELDETIKKLQAKKEASQVYLNKAEANYQKAVKTAERENEVLKSAYKDAALDTAYKVDKNINGFNGSVSTAIHMGSLNDLSGTAGKINDYQKILSDENVDKNSAEYVRALTEQNRAMNGFFEDKNQYVSDVDSTKQAVANVRDTVDTVVSVGLNFVPVAGSALSTGYTAGTNAMKNYEAAMTGDGVLSKSEGNDMAVGVLTDVATGAVSKVSGDVIGKFTGMIPKLGGKIAPAAQEVLLNGVQNIGANYISSFVSDHPGLDTDVKHELERFANAAKGAAPAALVDALKVAFRTLA